MFVIIVYIILFFVRLIQYIGIDTGFNRRVQHELIGKVIRVASPAEPYLGTHQPELLQIIVDCPSAYPELGGELIPAPGPFHPYQAVHPVDPFYIADY